MKYYDQHLHTNFSFDSDATFEDYLKQAPSYFVTTEHLDFHNPVSDYRDDLPDDDAYREKIAQLAQEYDTHFLKGIEVGYTTASKEQIESYLADKEFDLILLSIHQNGQYDFSNCNKEKMNVHQMMMEYFTLMLEGIQNVKGANVLAHFDYGLRNFSLSVEALQAYESQLKEIFTAAIQKQIAFELNTKSMYRYENEALYRYGIKLYQSLGGKYFTIGSDAHNAEKFESYFEQAIQLLQDLHVSDLTVYQSGQPIKIAINR
ncbi:PHP domain-containing protein [Isobaculum melis]|uniref:Histidinol-phosphatase n=1 Tax=Isobaculum melis TaxID=142588 RepID=A0A1H9QRD1_9LACT|nr:PHP domain-containing protein [Isobaculum melis]SER63012.1 histidinol-phosphatase (PHP family) [Isobaculum melis]